MPRIDCLDIENYRGASTRLRLDLNAGKQVVLIFGESGTGKTTIVDALDAVGNCSKGSLEDKSSTRARSHLPTIGRTYADVRISVTAGSHTWNTTLAGDNLTTNPEPRPEIRVLRRSHLQRLIEAQPAQRYEALRHFIDVDKVERSENALRDAATRASAELDATISRRVDAEVQLNRVWEAEGRPGDEADEWANAVIEQDTTSLDHEVQRLRHAQIAITRAETAPDELRRARADAIQRESEAQAIEDEVVDLPGIDAQQVISLTGILKQVSQHLQIGVQPDECPICRQGIPLDELKADIQMRLTDLQQYDQLRIRRESATRNIQIAHQSVESKGNALLTAACSLLDIVQAAEIEIVTASRINQNDYAVLAEEDGTGKEAALEQAEQLVSAFVAIKQALENSETATSRQSGLINSIRVQYEQIQECTASSESLASLKAGLQEAYNAVRLTRIECTQKILDEIAAECNRLYAVIHPNEPIAISKLALDQGRRASLNQAATFEGHNDVPPQAYFSESHLDTLGFCFWLALVKCRTSMVDTVVVLEDVFTSIDAQHINWISQLITDESQYFAQIIVTTHQRLWRDIYRYQHGAGRLIQLIELQNWSLSKGISHYKTRLAVDELVAFITATPFDRQITSSKAGILLEAILDWLALQYRSQVPRTHDGSYTLGELLDGTASLFKRLEVHRPDLDAAGDPKDPVGYISSNATHITSQLRSLNFIRSQVGAHFNIAGSAVSDADVQQFADLTVKLAEALSCPTCGQIPGKKTATYFQCSCASLFDVRLLPIQL